MTDKSRPPPDSRSPDSAAAEFAEHAAPRLEENAAAELLPLYPSPFEEPGIQLIKTQLMKSSRATGDIDTIKRPAHAARVLREMIGNADREHFVALYLNSRYRITHAYVVSIGLLNTTLVHPREVFKGALLANAAALIVGHNHPSDDIRPSTEDDEMHKRLKEASTLIGIPLLDSLIVGPGLHAYSHNDGAETIAPDMSKHARLDL